MFIQIFSIINRFVFTFFLKDEDEGPNTSDEEFERQLEEAAILQQAEKESKAAAPKGKAKMKRGRGPKHRRRNKAKANGDGGEVSEVACRSVRAQIAETLGSTSIRHRSDKKCRIDV